MQSRLIGILAVVYGMTIGSFGMGLEGLQLQIYMVWQCWWCDFEWILEVKIGLQENRRGRRCRMQSRLIGILAVVYGMSIGSFGMGLEGLQLQIYMVWQCWWCHFEWILEVKIGFEGEQTGKEVQDVEQIDRDISCGVWDEHWKLWDGIGGFVAVDLHGLVVLVV